MLFDGTYCAVAACLFNGGKQLSDIRFTYQDHGGYVLPRIHAATYVTLKRFLFGMRADMTEKMLGLIEAL